MDFKCWSPLWGFLPHFNPWTLRSNTSRSKDFRTIEKGSWTHALIFIFCTWHMEGLLKALGTRLAAMNVTQPMSRSVVRKVHVVFFFLKFVIPHDPHASLPASSRGQNKTWEQDQSSIHGRWCDSKSLPWYESRTERRIGAKWNNHHKRPNAIGIQRPQNDIQVWKWWYWDTSRRNFLFQKLGWTQSFKSRTVDIEEWSHLVDFLRGSKWQWLLHLLGRVFWDPLKAFERNMWSQRPL